MLNFVHRLVGFVAILFGAWLIAESGEAQNITSWLLFGVTGAIFAAAGCEAMILGPKDRSK